MKEPKDDKAKLRKRLNTIMKFVARSEITGDDFFGLVNEVAHKSLSCKAMHSVKDLTTEAKITHQDSEEEEEEEEKVTVADRKDTNADLEQKLADMSRRIAEVENQPMVKKKKAAELKMELADTAKRLADVEKTLANSIKKEGDLEKSLKETTKSLTIVQKSLVDLKEATEMQTKNRSASGVLGNTQSSTSRGVASMADTFSHYVDTQPRYSGNRPRYEGTESPYQVHLSKLSVQVF
ncbi:hypothetical protein UCRPA7_103 [Phaeoacremonium minimum UCRPA7]|uniref:Uncharacterized protein n=1 Tax=Phaeoacremonium minimum (strain UCR-PA7) TaxID=1286976 RepID=R8BYB4_PHAM7|nr:hypothetical protein UCRPA7_103 [Phaeoacremonium minimum UCRPA7]EOO04343.1 hypothetical protein UCRPA7_103 [Phaeoacremonium minimum UCRPA7]